MNEQAVYEQLRELAKKYDITIVTAKQAPRLHPCTFPPLPRSDVIFIDYIDILRPAS